MISAHRRPMLHRAHAAAFLGCLAAILYLGLRPEPASRALSRFSAPLGLWEGRHDNWSNFIAFFVLASLGFWMASSPSFRFPLLDKFWAEPRRRLLCFLALVAGIEFAQIWIPNRVSDLHDVLTGWSGILSAGLLRMCGRSALRERPRL